MLTTVMLHVPRVMGTTVYRTSRTCVEGEHSRCAFCCEDVTQAESKHVAGRASVVLIVSSCNDGWRGYGELK